jgi:hypothetical protein
MASAKRTPFVSGVAETEERLGIGRIDGMCAAPCFFGLGRAQRADEGMSAQDVGQRMAGPCGDGAIDGRDRRVEITAVERVLALGEQRVRIVVARRRGTEYAMALLVPAAAAARAGGVARCGRDHRDRVSLPVRRSARRTRLMPAAGFLERS